MTISLIVELALSGPAARDDRLLCGAGTPAVGPAQRPGRPQGNDRRTQSAIVAAGASMRALKAHAAGAARDAGRTTSPRPRHHRRIVDADLVRRTHCRPYGSQRPAPRAAINGATPAVLASRLDALGGNCGRSLEERPVKVRFSRHLRLLPAVMVLGVTLLGLKATGLVMEARAQDAGTTTAPASQQATPTQSAEAGDAADDPETSTAHRSTCSQASPNAAPNSTRASTMSKCARI